MALTGAISKRFESGSDFFEWVNDFETVGNVALDGAASPALVTAWYEFMEIVVFMSFSITASCKRGLKVMQSSIILIKLEK